MLSSCQSSSFLPFLVHCCFLADFLHQLSISGRAWICVMMPSCTCLIIYRQNRGSSMGTLLHSAENAKGYLIQWLVLPLLKCVEQLCFLRRDTKVLLLRKCTAKVQWLYGGNKGLTSGLLSSSLTGAFWKISHSSLHATGPQVNLWEPPSCFTAAKF